MKTKILNKVLTFFILITSISFGQKKTNEPTLKICDNCLQEVFEQTFKASKEALPGTHQESVNFELNLFLKQSKTGLLYVGDADYITIIDGTDTLKAGRFASDIDLVAPLARYLVPIKLKKGNNSFYVLMKEIDGKLFTVKPTLILGAKIEDVIPLFYAQNENARIVNIICFILLTLLMLYSGYQTVLMKNRIFLTYGIYLFTVLVFLFVFSDEYLQWHLLFPNDLWQYGAYNIIFQGLIYVAYVEFGNTFLDLRNKFRWIYKVSRMFQIMTLILTFSHTAYLIWSGGDQAFIFKYFYKVYFILTLISTYITFYIIFKIKDPYRWLLIIGSSVLGWAVAYEVIQIFVMDIPKPRDFFYSQVNGFMHFSFIEISYVVECVIFLMGINFKNNKKERELKGLRERVISQLEEKEKLEREVNVLLKDKLDVSRKELEMEQVSTENERNKLKLMQSQLTSLQLQMNPHYLFNSLNSINDFIISKKAEEASEYLALYARMMRSILRSSDKTIITLDQELIFCEDYLRLESLRFEGRFEFNILKPKSLSILEMKIPGMMLQPILENAVWHGIMPLKSKGKITLDASKSDMNCIIVIISDNGNGIESSSEKLKKDSYGLNNIKEKIALIERIYGLIIKFEMINLQNNKGLSVRFEFPDFSTVKQ